MMKHISSTTTSVASLWRVLLAFAMSMFMVAGVTFAVTPTAHAEELGVEVIQDAYLVDADGNRITELVEGAPAPHELRMTISIPEGVKDGDKLKFSFSQATKDDSGERQSSPYSMWLLWDSTSQILSAADETTVIADVNVTAINAFEIVFNGNADAERGNALYTNAYDVSVLLEKREDTIKLDSVYRNVWTDNPDLAGEVAYIEKGRSTVTLQQSKNYSRFGKEFALLDTDYERHHLYYHETLYPWNYPTNSGSIYGEKGVPQPTEMLIKWSVKADLYVASSPESGPTKDLTFTFEVPEGFDIKKGRNGSYVDISSTQPKKYRTKEEAMQAAKERGQKSGWVIWGERGGDDNRELSEQLRNAAQATLSEDGRTLTVTIPDAPTDHSYRIIADIDRIYSEYKGDIESATFKLHVPEGTHGKGFTGELSTAPIDREVTLTSVLPAKGGLADASQVRRVVEMSITANDGQKMGEDTLVTPGKVTYTVKLHNKSNVTVRVNGFELPDGTFVDMQEHRIRAGSTEEFTFEVDETAFAGAQERTFKADIALMDEVTGSISIRTSDPAYPEEAIDVPQTVSTTVPAPAGVPEGVTFAPTDKTPEWVKVNEDGSLTVTPPKNQPAGEYPIEIEMTYPEGSKETITATVNITEVPAAGLDPFIVISGEPAPDPTDYVSNLKDLPEGTTVTWKDNAPATDQLGQSEQTVVVTYPDGSTEEITVPVAVVMNQAQYDELMKQRENARNSVNDLENRLNTGLGRCIGTVGGSLIALIPAVLIASQLIGGLHIPQLDNYFAEVQKRLGIFNPQLAHLVDQNRGAIAGGIGALGILGLLLAPNTCRGTSLGSSIVEPLSSK